MSRIAKKCNSCSHFNFGNFSSPECIVGKNLLENKQKRKENLRNTMCPGKIIFGGEEKNVEDALNCPSFSIIKASGALEI